MSASLKKDKIYFNNGRKAWQCAIMQRADDPDIARANRQLKEDLQMGANGVAVVFAGAHNAWGFGLPPLPDTMEQLFDGIDLANVHIRIDNHPHGQILTEKCVEFLQKRRIEQKSVRITFGIDPIANLAATGKLKMSLAALSASLPQSMSAFFSSGLPGVVLEADGRPFHNAGASCAQEIGIMLAIADNYLKMVEAARHHIAYALPHIGFATALDQDTVQGMVKLRVLQMLWEKLQAEHNIAAPFHAPVHVETSMRMMTKRNSLTNITRAAAAAFAAVAGGAGSLSVLPYSLPAGLPDNAARREARNSALVFTRETAPKNLLSAHALIPNSALTEQLAAAAWEEFQILDRQGGILQSLVSGDVVRRINETRDLHIAACLKGDSNIINAMNLSDDSAAENSVLSGIYDWRPIVFQAEGIEHCPALSFSRIDSLFEEAAANAARNAH